MKCDLRFFACVSLILTSFTISNSARADSPARSLAACTEISFEELGALAESLKLQLNKRMTAPLPPSSFDSCFDGIFASIPRGGVLDQLTSEFNDLYRSDESGEIEDINRKIFITQASRASRIEKIRASYAERRCSRAQLRHQQLLELPGRTGGECKELETEYPEIKALVGQILKVRLNCAREFRKVFASETCLVPTNVNQTDTANPSVE